MNSKLILLTGGILSSLIVFFCLKNQYTNTPNKTQTQKNTIVSDNRTIEYKPATAIVKERNDTNTTVQSKPQKIVKKDIENFEQNITKDKNTTQNTVAKKETLKKVEIAKKPTIIKTATIQHKINNILRKKPIYFKFGSNILTKDSKKTLNLIIKILTKQGATYDLFIGGHTDGYGDKQYNKKLSQKRADIVKKYLQYHFKNINKISAKGYGSSKPKYRNKKDKRNRRVEIIIRRGYK